MSQQDQISVMEIQSLMTQINNVMNKKSEEKEKEHKDKRKLKASIECLSRTLKN